ncbi:MAG: hypothetical protein JXA03_16985 [Bacteroidales bacterium]|nr:hypothetical protein [Bacteroidales bacterium]
MSDSRTLGLTFKEVLLIDSTTIRLFSDLLKGVGRNPKNDGKKKGGLKVYKLIDAVQSVGRFIMKQNFQLHYFYGENENAIRTQVWCTLIAQLLMTIIQKMAQTKKAYSVVASLVRIHLISLLDVFELLRSTKREYLKKAGFTVSSLQTKLAF